jgi:hypothetical protein
MSPVGQLLPCGVQARLMLDQGLRRTPIRWVSGPMAKVATARWGSDG